MKQDYDKAHRLFKLAADQGWVDGQLNLGHMYYSKFPLLITLVYIIF